MNEKMNIEDAIRVLKRGKDIRRAVWQKDMYISYLSNSYIHIRDTSQPWIVNPEDLLANDWEYKPWKH